ncbi:MAG TPA: hypothetical protein VMH61_01220 [Candidatus Acidoferrales bacterium]|nr:hypothetical protein [Candidatus Acidoferrales bacterium]
MSPLSRRRFLALAGLGVLGGAAAAAVVRRRRLFEWLARPSVEVSPVGALSGHASATLLATAHTLLDERITGEVYTDFFAWRAANVPGFRELYEAFTRGVDAASRRRGARDFAGAPLEVRRDVISALAPRQRWEHLTGGLLARQSVRWSQHVVHEIMRLFAHTDAWLRLGYDAYAGTPAGLAGLDAPPKASGGSA